MSKESIYRAIDENKQYLAEAMKRMKFPVSEQLIREDHMVAQCVLKEIRCVIAAKGKAEAKANRRQEHIQRMAYLVGSIFADGFVAADLAPMLAEAVKAPLVRTRKRSKPEPEQYPAQQVPQTDPA